MGDEDEDEDESKIQEEHKQEKGNEEVEFVDEDENPTHEQDVDVKVKSDHSNESIGESDGNRNLADNVVHEEAVGRDDDATSKVEEKPKEKIPKIVNVNLNNLSEIPASALVSVDEGEEE